MRQQPFFDVRSSRSAQLTTLSYEYPDAYLVREHFHDTDQLVFASQGVMTVRTKFGIWVVPPRRAVWIPAKTVHSISMSGAVSMRTLYFKPGFVRALPRRCCVINVSSLLRELILHACNTPLLSKKVPVQRSLLGILEDQLQAAGSTPLQLPRPVDPRASRVAEFVLRSPAGSPSLAQICRRCGASKRTIERLFLKETQMTLGRWRQQARLLYGITLIAGGQKITAAALEAGYNSPSAFITMFKKILGSTPARYFET
jgi:AraC-like DNA-binding protein